MTGEYVLNIGTHALMLVFTRDVFPGFF